MIHTKNGKILVNSAGLLCKTCCPSGPEPPEPGECEYCSAPPQFLQVTLAIETQCDEGHCYMSINPWYFKVKDRLNINRTYILEKTTACHWEGIFRSAFQQTIDTYYGAGCAEFQYSDSGPIDVKITAVRTSGTAQLKAEILSIPYNIGAFYCSMAYEVSAPCMPASMSNQLLCSNGYFYEGGTASIE